MNYVTLDALPVSEGIRVMLAKTPGVDGCVVHDKAGHLRVAVFGPDCDHVNLDAVLAEYPKAHAAWLKSGPVNRKGRTGLALDLLKSDPTMTPYAAAKAAGVDVAAVYRAINRRKSRGTCSCCGQLLPVQSD